MTLMQPGSRPAVRRALGWPPCHGCRWPTRHALRAAAAGVRILRSGTAVEMTASPGWE